MENILHSVKLLLTLVILISTQTHSLPVKSDDLLKFKSVDAKNTLQHEQVRWKYRNAFEQDSIDMQDFQEIMTRMDSSKRDIADSIECYVCKAVTWVMQQTLWHNNDQIAEIVDAVCTNLKIEQPDICHGIIKIFQDEVLTVIDLEALSPHEMCGMILGSECATFYNPYQMWDIAIPKPPTEHNTSYKESTQKVSSLRVLHLADIHLDLDYVVGSSVDCGRPLCCRNISSDPVNGSEAGPWGSYGPCDLPRQTLEHLFTHLSHNDKFDYIIWTGDLSSHSVWTQSRDKILHHVDYLTALLLKYFPSTPVYWSLGNHESVPVNGFPPPYIKGSSSISWLYTHISKVWGNWLPQSTLKNITRGGFYSVEVHPGYRLVSLNMNYCNNQNWWMLLNTTDPAGELEWFVSVLHQAELLGEKVHVIGHIPPGKNSCLKAWSWNYYKIVTRFWRTLAGQFFSHTHTDGIEIFYDAETRSHPLSVAYVAPSVTTFINMNPAYRVYTMDGFYNNSTWSVLDHETYILNLTEANKQQDPQWQLEYTAKNAYHLDDLSPSSWQKFSETLLHNNHTAMLYHRYTYKSSPSYASFDQNWTISVVCDMRTGRSHDPGFCHDLNLDRRIFKQWLLDNTMC